MRTCFLLSYVPNPRMNKRIALFKELGNVSVICTRRKSQNIWELEHRDIENFIYDIDLPSISHMFKRYLLSYKFKRKALKKLNEMQPDVICLEGLDCLQIANTYWKKHKKVKIIYEVADLRECFIERQETFLERFITLLISKTEMKCIEHIAYLIVTSRKFYDCHYNKLVDSDKVIFMPNTPAQDAFVTYKKKTEGTFTVGFIGGIRYLKQMKMLVDVAQEVGCNVIFAGTGGTLNEFAEIQEYCKNKPFIKFTGRYDYKKEIASLYSMVDCVYAVYDADNPNVRIALPNKLYEAVLCKLPIIVAKGTYLSELVEHWGVGIAVDHKNSSELISALSDLRDNHEYYHAIEECCERRKNETELAIYNSDLKQKIKYLDI